MKKIALVCFKFPPVYSGYGKQLQLVTEDILRKHNDVTIEVLTAYSESESSSGERLNVNSLLKKENDSNSKSIFPFSIEVGKWLIRNRHTYDVIHCVKAGPEAITCHIIGKWLKKPVIVKVAQDELSDQEINSVNGLKRKTRLFRQRLLKNVDYFIAISDEIDSNLKKRIGENTKILRIPNGVDTISKYTPASSAEKKGLRNKLSLPESEVVMLYIGAVNKRKGIHNLLDALQLSSLDKKMKVVICGPILEDIGFEETIEKINQNMASVSVDYRGKVSNVEEYMKASDLFILPSYSEGLPNVLLEAGASGLPLITTDIGGSRDIVVDGENGLVVNLNSPSEINEAFATLVHDADLRKTMGLASRNRVSTLFSLEKVSEAYYKLYKELK